MQHQVPPNFKLQLSLKVVPYFLKLLGILFVQTLLVYVRKPNDESKKGFLISHFSSFFLGGYYRGIYINNYHLKQFLYLMGY